MRLDENIIRQSIENLKISHPDLMDDQEAWVSSLESETNFNEVLTTIVRRIEDTRALASGTKERLDELRARKDRFEHRIETLRNLAFKIMAAAELPKLELPECTLSLRAGTPSVVITNEAALPDELCRFERKPDKTKIKEWLTSGGIVTGATISNSPPSLTIRVK
jgi:hypothetical protein